MTTGLASDDERAARLSTVTRSQELPAPHQETALTAVRRPNLVPEVLLVVALYMGYSIARYAGAGHPSTAYHHAAQIWRLERWVHLPSEASLQDLALKSPRLMELANLHYQVGYIVSLVGVLLWLYIWHPRHYLWYRRFLTVVTATGLVGQLFFPMAPPRLLAGDRVVDSAHLYGHAVYGAVGTGLANQFAAMPSLHVGWALVAAMGLIAVLRSRWRWLWLLHPIITLGVVVITGNHFWSDGIVGALIVGASAMAARRWLPEPAVDHADQSVSSAP